MKAISIPDLRAIVRVHDLPGDGLPLVFLHGLGCASSCDYPPVVRAPALRGRRAILVDLPGSGYSDRPIAFDYSIQAHARVVVAIVEALSLPALDLFGHSMGGAVAIEAASLLSTRVRHLILSEPNLDAGGGTFSRAMAAETEADYVARGHGDAIRAATHSGNHVWAGSMATTAPFAAHRAAVSLVRGGSPSWREQLHLHPAQRTVLFGEGSLPDADFDGLPQQGIAVAAIPGAGHSMAWENPPGLAQAIADACARPVPHATPSSPPAIGLPFP